MNKDRRKALEAIVAALEAVDLESPVGDLEGLRDEEREAFENMEAGGLGETENAQRMSEAADSLDEAVDALGEVLEAIQTAVDKIREAVEV